jgi:hypothetical protein
MVQKSEMSSKQFTLPDVLGISEVLCVAFVSNKENNEIRINAVVMTGG